MNKVTQDMKNQVEVFLKSQLPISGKFYNLDIEDMSFTEPKETQDYSAQSAMKYSKTGNLKGYLRGKLVIRSNDTGDVVVTPRTVNVAPIYIATDRGTYIVNGNEKSVENQMRLKPGVYTSNYKQKLGTITEMRFDTSPGSKYFPKVEMEFSPDTQKFRVTVFGNPKTTFDGVNFLREIGFSDQEILKAMGNTDEALRVIQDAKGAKTIYDIYKVFTGKDSSETPSKTRSLFYEYISSSGKFGSGEKSLKNTIGVSSKTLDKNVISSSVKRLFEVSSGGEADDADDLRFKDVLSPNDLLLEKLKTDFENFRQNSLEHLNNEKTPDLKVFGAARSLGKSMETFMTQSQIVKSSEETNPLFMASINQALTQLGSGDGGIQVHSNTNESLRNLKRGGFGRIDPIETPESSTIGLVERLAQSAKVKNGTIYAPFLKVFGSEVQNTASNTVELSPQEEYDAKVAYFDSEYVKRSGSTITFKKNKVPARYQGKDVMLPISEVEYLDKSPQNLFNFTANSVPFVNFNDGNRALMGTNMQRQAIDIKGKEAPLTTTSFNGTSKTYDEVIGEDYGKPIRSTVDGKVSKITDDDIIVTDDNGNAVLHKYYNYYPLNQSYINNEIIVKVGDSVKKNQILAEGWQTKDGKLALGKNVNLGYLSYKGLNHEDGIVISEDLAEQMSSVNTDDYSITIKDDAIGGKGSGVKAQLKKYTTNADLLSKIDEDGIVKNGTYIRPGDVLAVILIPEVIRDNVMASALFGSSGGTNKYLMKTLSIPKTSKVEGEIKRISVVPSNDGVSKQEIIFTLSSTSPMKVGDKLAGRHGNKGTVTKILPTEEMPYREDGVRLDLLFSPAATPSRKNPGQLLELGSGLIATKTGGRRVIDNFDDTEKKKVQDGLKSIGYKDGKMGVFVPEKVDGKIVPIATDNPVAVGNAYIMRLNANIDDKAQSRSALETGVEAATYMPKKETGNAVGEKHNPQSIGEMEFRALESKGAAWNMLELGTLKADGGGDKKKRVAIFNALSNKNLDAMELPVTPESLQATANTLKGFGLDLRPINNGKRAKSFDEAFDSMKLVHMKPSEIIKTIGKDKEVKSFQQFTAKEDGKDVAEKGGLFDPDIFGEPFSEDSRNNWGYIKLPTPIPNPVLMDKPANNPYIILTGLKSKDLKALMSGGRKASVLIIDQKSKGEDYTQNMLNAGLKVGDVVSADKLEDLMDKHGTILWKAGGEGVQYLLDKIDVKKEIKSTKAALDGAKSGDETDALFKRLKTLNMLDTNKMEASDLMMQYVPVLPTYMRPNVQMGKDYVVSDLNKLYQNLLKTTSATKELYSDGFNMAEDANPLEAAKDTSNIYSKVNQIMGLETGKDPRSGKEIQGLKSRISGKNGLVRGKLLSKRVDYSARTVIGIDPELGVDEVGIPIDTAKYTYKPFILGGLVKKGYAKDYSEAEKKWEIMDKDARKVLEAEVKDRPVLLNRQPTLHGLGIQAFNPVLKEFQDGGPVRNIQLNPLTMTGFNADLDGDQMAAHVPVTPMATKEAKEMLMPSQNLMNPLTGKLQIEIRHEMALGIYHLTTDANKPEGEPKKYSRYSELRKDYKEGKIKTRDAVNIYELSNITAGYAMFILLLPEEFRSSSYHPVDKPWSAKDVNSVLAQMYEISEQTNGKKYSKTDITNVANRLKDLGFEASTRSGISIGINDLDVVDTKSVKSLYVEEDIKSGKNPSDMVDSEIDTGVKVIGKVKKGIADGTLLDSKNPVSIMLKSGARGNADQFTKIMGTVGIGMDVTNKITKPVKSAFVDGLSPREYFNHSYDSRKGMFDRSVATFVPGALSRDIWSITQHLTVKENDCGTTEGIELAKGSSAIVGRVANKNILDDDGNIIKKRGQVIEKEDLQKINSQDTIKVVPVRSPTKCKVVKGVCQKCYGRQPGSMSFVKLGTAVGTIASQSIGETFTQSSLNTFHSGGISTNTAGLPKIKNILNLSDNIRNKATIAEVSGDIQQIKKGTPGTYDSVIISGQEHRIPHLNNQAPNIKVEVGDKIVKGDFLTVGDLSDMTSGSVGYGSLTSASPLQLFNLKKDSLGQEKALDYTRDYMSESLDQAIRNSAGDKVDRRQSEVIVKELTSSVRVLDSGDSNFIKGDVIEKNVADKWNADNATSRMAKSFYLTDEANLVNKVLSHSIKDKKGVIHANTGDIVTRDLLTKLRPTGIKELRVLPRPIVYDSELKSMIGLQTKPTSTSFFSGMGGSHIMDHISRGATFGEEETFDDPRSRRMAGKLSNIGTGFKIPRKFADNVANSFYNFFSGDKK